MEKRNASRYVTGMSPPVNLRLNVGSKKENAEKQRTYLLRWRNQISSQKSIKKMLKTKNKN